MIIHTVELKTPFASLIHFMTYFIFYATIDDLLSSSFLLLEIISKHILPIVLSFPI